MYHVHDTTHGAHVFTVEDPRRDGYAGPVDEGVTLTLPTDLNLWPYEAERPKPTCFGVSPDAKAFEDFASREDCIRRGFTPLADWPSPHARWSGWLELLSCGQD